MADKITRTEAEWRSLLTPQQYDIARNKGTERAFSHPGFEKGEGVFRCVGCGAALFQSDAKFESGCGWPSFDRPIDETALEEHDDRSFMMRRTEIVCSHCESHLGHVFPDGPTETGLRYCINGAVLDFDKESGSGSEES